MRVRLIRNATLVVELGGRRLLVDPMLDPAGARPPVEDSVPLLRNPLVELPCPVEEVVRGVDTVLVSHLHQDHLDATGAAAIAHLPVLCQPGDEEALAARGIADLRAVEDELSLGDVRVHRTAGRHGVGHLADLLGPVSGWVLSAGGETLYVAGDTIWCADVERALAEHRPDVVVVNAAGARFVGSERLVMDVADVLATCDAAPDAMVVAVHLEAVNHCPVTRAELRAAGRGRGLSVPEDGEVLEL